MVTGGKAENALKQTSHLLKSFRHEDRIEILKNSNISSVAITPEAMVALKVDMGIPWEKMKTMARWLKTFDIDTASQSKQRKIAKSWQGDDIITDNTPFRFEVKDKKAVYEIRAAAWCYIEDLPSHIIGYLEKLLQNTMIVNRK